MSLIPNMLVSVNKIDSEKQFETVQYLLMQWVYKDEFSSMNRWHPINTLSDWIKYILSTFTYPLIFYYSAGNYVRPRDTSEIPPIPLKMRKLMLSDNDRLIFLPTKHLVWYTFGSYFNPIFRGEGGG